MSGVDARGIVPTIQVYLPLSPPPTAAERRRVFWTKIAQAVCTSVIAPIFVAVVVELVVGDSASAESGTGNTPRSTGEPDCVKVLARVTADAQLNPDEVKLLLTRHPNGQTLVTRAEYVACGTRGQITLAARAGLP
jgi:hypothetical protein